MSLENSGSVKVVEMIEAVLIGFCVELIWEEISLVPILGMLNFWGETRLHPQGDHVMVTLQGVCKGLLRTIIKFFW